MEERCENCKFCSKLYIPPRHTVKAEYKYCCTLFLKSDNEVMQMDSNIGCCECFTEREEKNVYSK